MAKNIPSRTSNTRENGNTQPSVIDTPIHPTCQGVEKASLEFVIVVLVNGSDDQLSDVINRSNMSAKKGNNRTEGAGGGGRNTSDWRGNSRCTCGGATINAER